MDKLNELRKEIDNIDEELQQLFIKRMQIVSEIYQEKEKNLTEILDANRENQIYEKIKNSNNEIIQKYYTSIQNEIINVSKKYQKDLRDTFKK